MKYQTVRALLEEKGQAQLLRYYDELNAAQQAALLEEIGRVDWSVFSSHTAAQDAGEISPIRALRLSEIAARRQEFEEVGREAIRRGEVAAVVLAGGQGTRLGSSAPKGAFDIGLTRPVYIFELLVRTLQGVCERCGGRVPLLVMTSDKNDRETRAFFAEHDYFGYPKEDISFFVQDMAPATDFDGKILLEEKGKLALSPNGNGGWYASLLRAGLLPSLKARGVTWFNVFAVDNVLQKMADPAFIGATILSGASCGAKVVRKAYPEERVGVLCRKDGKPYVIEYYELSKEMANARDEEGELLYGCGVILNYLFHVEELERIVAKQLPVHIAKKKVVCLNERGEQQIPAAENAFKYETLILDMVRLMGDCLPFEVEREREFAPIKNATGVDSVESARVLLKQNGVEL